MIQNFLYTLPIIIFNGNPDIDELQLFKKAPETWKEVQENFPGISFRWVNRKGLEEVVENEETYSKSLKNSNGQGHFFSTDYPFEAKVQLDLNIEPIAKHFLLCLRCEYKNSLFFIKCVNCSNSNRSLLVFKKGKLLGGEKW